MAERENNGITDGDHVEEKEAISKVCCNEHSPTLSKVLVTTESDYHKKNEL